MLTLSEVIGPEGIEHHQSSDNRDHEDFLANSERQLADGDLLPHEISHSWNGKYRRPQDLTTPNFQIPMKTDLLWVYEGLNEYLGHLLTYRAGIREGKLYPEQVASIYAELDSEPGRERDPLIDTAAAAPYLYSASGDYTSLRRTSNDFYTEGHLLWLDVDTTIRERTGGKKSLDDFLHLFAGPPNTGPATKTYTREELEQLLNSLLAADWHAYFQQHVYEISIHPPMDEIERSGWKLVFTERPNTFDQTEAELKNRLNLWYSLGMKISDEGDVLDVRQNSPAWQAGLTPNMKVIAVDRQSFSKEVLTYAIRSAQRSTAPITMLVKQDEWYQTRQVAYHGGLRYPHLIRLSNKPDLLSKITAAHAH